MIIRSAEDKDIQSVVDVELAAFGEEDEAELVRALLADPTAQPCISLLAEEGQSVVGHVLCTHGLIESDDSGAGTEATPVMILGPVAVVPQAQNKGVGRAMIWAAADVARSIGYGGMTVLGHVDYYPKHGFSPAADAGIHPPYPVDPADAFMVLELHPGALEDVSGTLRPAETFMRPEYWRE